MAWDNLHAEVVVLFASLSRGPYISETWAATALAYQREKARRDSKQKRWRDRFILKVMRARYPKWVPAPAVTIGRIRS